jgi:hypothetical protein
MGLAELNPMDVVRLTKLGPEGRHFICRGDFLQAERLRSKEGDVNAQ